MDNVQNLVGISMEKVKEMVDANTIIGTPITAGTMTLIPVSKVSYGFVGGGSDLPSKTPSAKFGGGTGAGINITPVAFLALSGDDVQVFPILSKPDTNDSVISMIPELVDKITALFKKDKKKPESSAE